MIKYLRRSFYESHLIYFFPYGLSIPGIISSVTIFATGLIVAYSREMFLLRMVPNKHENTDAPIFPEAFQPTEVFDNGVGSVYPFVFAIMPISCSKSTTTAHKNVTKDNNFPYFDVIGMITSLADPVVNRIDAIVTM